MQKRIYIIGYGDVGAALAPLLLERDREVVAISRTNNRSFNDPAFRHIAVDLDRLENKDGIIESGADIVYLAPPPTQGTQESRISGFLQFLSTMNLTPRRIVYISATGVYGDCQGEWITEQTPVSPKADRAKRRIDAEQQIQNWCDGNDTDWIILRVAGIYGPGKLPLERLEKGITVLKEEIAPASNRIHIHDLARIIIAALESPQGRQIYNVADETPTSMSDYFLSVAKAFNLPAPAQVSWEEARSTMSPQMLSYLVESKKIDISKLKNQLHVSLLYPDLESGLKACLESQTKNP
jgi:nucleoside-diphosphate-sugar epimerase